jgi:hypothetical protein
MLNLCWPRDQSSLLFIHQTVHRAYDQKAEASNLTFTYLFVTQSRGSWSKTTEGRGWKFWSWSCFLLWDTTQQWCSITITARWVCTGNYWESRTKLALSIWDLYMHYNLHQNVLATACHRGDCIPQCDHSCSSVLHHLSHERGNTSGSSMDVIGTL